MFRRHDKQEESVRRLCAYCGKKKNLTKEHVWPNCFLERVGRDSAHYSPKSGKVHGADYVVRDVCAECNNLLLSNLDTYFCVLYDQYLAAALGANESVNLKYDYDLLCRVLLKIAYNTARSAGSDCLPFYRLSNYILNGGNCPTGVALFAELVSPTYIVDSDGPSIVLQEIRPPKYRSALGKLDSTAGHTVLCRVVAVNSFFFHLLLARDPEDIQTFEIAKNDFLASIPGIVLLDAEALTVHLRSSPQDSLSSMIPLLTAKSDQFQKFFQRKKESNEAEGR